MKPLQQKQKNTFHISLFVVAVLALLVIAFLVLTRPKAPKPIVVVTPIVEAVSKVPTIPEDSLKREREREIEREREGYAKEQVRFAKVLKEASDEELFVVLNYAIANHYVPNRDIDPFYNVHVMVGHWQRSLMVYNNLSNRKDLLKKIYPDLKVLDEYVKWGRQSGAPYPDTIVSKAIMDNVRKESSKMNAELIAKYYGRPLMCY
ncbi:MAG: hypothetical protein IKH61_00665 [Bacteroidales bacterium]|nr:hypothetical protein [Bacteroidales bacterium]